VKKESEALILGAAILPIFLVVRFQISVVSLRWRTALLLPPRDGGDLLPRNGVGCIQWIPPAFCMNIKIQGLQICNL